MDNLVKAVIDWVLSTEKIGPGSMTQRNKARKTLEKFKGKIPPEFTKYSGVVYRGFTIKGSRDDIINKIVNGKVKLKDHVFSSWTTNLKVAMMFTTHIILERKVSDKDIFLNIEEFLKFIVDHYTEQQIRNMIGVNVMMTLENLVKEHEILVLNKEFKIKEKDIGYVYDFRSWKPYK